MRHGLISNLIKTTEKASPGISISHHDIRNIQLKIEKEYTVAPTTISSTTLIASTTIANTTPVTAGFALSCNQTVFLESSS